MAMRWSVVADGSATEPVDELTSGSPPARWSPLERRTKKVAPNAATAARRMAVKGGRRWVMAQDPGRCPFLHVQERAPSLFLLGLAWGPGVGRLVALELRVEAVVRRGDVRERRAERDVVLVDAVPEGQLVALQVAADDAQGDVGDVVTETPAVREPLGVVGQDAEPVRARVDRHAEVDLQRVGGR